MASSLVMNRQYIDEQHVLTRYLAGQLSDTERDAFETYYVEHPQMLQELEIAAKLKLGLNLLEASGEFASPAKREWLSGLAAAAVVVAVITAFWFARPIPIAPLMATSMRALGDFAKAPQLADTFTIERTRSSGVDARLELPPRSRAISLRVLPELPGAQSYGLRMSFIPADTAPREVARLRSLRVDADGLITVYVNSQRLQPGSYEILLSPDSSATADTASSFLIMVEPAKPQ
jgi:hypothetical protein